MTASKQARQVEELLKQSNWHDERIKLRAVLLDCGLDETVKWGKLCYTCSASNIAIFYGLKDYCAVGFFKGSLLSDERGILVRPGRHSQAMRQIRFTSVDEIIANEDILIEYIGEAVQLEQIGLQVDFKEKHNLSYPTELKEYFDRDAEFARAFDRLTPGRQRGYVLHFSGAKQANTRVSRIEKSRQNVMAGKGRNER